MPATIDNQTGAIVYANTKQKAFKDANIAMIIYRTALSLEIDATLASQKDPKTQKDVFVVTLNDVTDEQIGLLERKTKITCWSATASAVANSVTTALTQVGDYALNGALAPTAVAVGNAIFTTGRVVGTAAVRVAGGTLASLAFNGRIMAKEIANSHEVGACFSEVKQCFSDAGTGFAKLFGVNSTAASGWNELPEAPDPDQEAVA